MWMAVTSGEMYLEMVWSETKVLISTISTCILYHYLWQKSTLYWFKGRTWESHITPLTFLFSKSFSNLFDSLLPWLCSYIYIFAFIDFWSSTLHIIHTYTLCCKEKICWDRGPLDPPAPTSCSPSFFDLHIQRRLYQTFWQIQLNLVSQILIPLGSLMYACCDHLYRIS